jgi:hypothetical protein
MSELASYGYRRVTTLLNCHLQLENKHKVNHKRICRIMKHHCLLLPAYGKNQPDCIMGKLLLFTATPDGAVILLACNVGMMIEYLLPLL